MLETVAFRKGGDLTEIQVGEKIHADLLLKTL